MSPANDVKLSICIPTYNRARFLEMTLALLAETIPAAYPYEIIISDNASTDDSSTVASTYLNKGLPIRYFRCGENTGYLPNLASALRLGRGDYLVYLADDDRLLWDELLQAIHVLDANPGIVACYAPWYMYDDINQRDVMQFYVVDQDCVISQRDFAGAFNFIVDKVIFPEMGVYRAGAFRSASSPRHFAYWAFSHFTHYLDLGAVAFLKAPFYRSVFNFRIEQQGAPAGITETMTSWDRYRGGLEYLLYFGMKRGSITIDETSRPHYDALTKQFMIDRMLAAMRLWITRNDYLNAYELYCRLVVAGYEELPDLVNVRGSLRPMAAAQALVRLANQTAGVQRLIILNISNVAALAEDLAGLGLSKTIELIPHFGSIFAKRPGVSVVFVRHPSERTDIIAKGYEPNLVVCEEDLTESLLV